MTDPLRHLFSRLDHEQSPLVTATELRRWPAMAVSFLTSTGILREVAPAESMVYDGCDEGCVITPDLVENPETGHVTGVHYCKRDGCGRITIDPDDLRQWEPHFEALASMVARELDLGAAASPVVPDRIYLLGTMPTGGGPLDVYLARGLAWNDAVGVVEGAGRLAASQSAVVLVPTQPPPLNFWRDVRRDVLSLEEHVSWDYAQSRMNVSQLDKMVRALRPPAPKAHWITVTAGAKLLMKDIPGLKLEIARSRISVAANRKGFHTNGKKGRERRIERTSFDAWRLMKRDRDLDAEDQGR